MNVYKHSIPLVSFPFPLLHITLNTDANSFFIYLFCWACLDGTAAYLLHLCSSWLSAVVKICHLSKIKTIQFLHETSKLHILCFDSLYLPFFSFLVCKLTEIKVTNHLNWDAIKLHWFSFLEVKLRLPANRLGN